MEACKKALEEGEYFGDDLGDYIGIKKLDPDWFKAPADSTGTKIGNVVLKIFLIGILALLIIGIITVIKWGINI